jgi:hypothetical protein
MPCLLDQKIILDNKTMKMRVAKTMKSMVLNSYMVNYLMTILHSYEILKKCT